MSDFKIWLLISSTIELVQPENPSGLTWFSSLMLMSPIPPLSVTSNSTGTKNCVLHWDPRWTWVLSESFSLAPSEEININLQSVEVANYGDSTKGGATSSTAWVVCDNTQSPKVIKTIGRLSP